MCEIFKTIIYLKFCVYLIGNVRFLRIFLINEWGRLFLINCLTNISYKKLGSAGGTKIKIKSVLLPLRDEKRN